MLKYFNKMKIEKTGWYKSKSIVGWLAFFDLEKNIVYGFNINGSWFLIDSMYTDFYEIEPATEEESKERLKAEAIERGYVEGAEIDNSNLNFDDAGEGNFIVNNSFIFELDWGEIWMKSNLGYSRCIFKNGKWAKITKHAKEPQEKTFPRMMEVRDESDDDYDWKKRKVEFIWDKKAWSRSRLPETSDKQLCGWSEYREIESNEKADKIEELEENLKYIEDGLNAYLDGIEQIKAEIQKLK